MPPSATAISRASPFESSTEALGTQRSTRSAGTASSSSTRAGYGSPEPYGVRSPYGDVMRSVDIGGTRLAVTDRYPSHGPTSPVAGPAPAQTPGLSTRRSGNGAHTARPCASARTGSANRVKKPKENTVLTIGVICLILGLIFSIPVLWTIGIILCVIGLVLLLLGTMDRAVMGRRYWY